MNVREWWMLDAQQQAFRVVLDAFARPGTQAVLGDALPQLLATVLDESVTLADPQHLLDADQRRLLLAPDAPPGLAAFVLFGGKSAPPADFEPALGTLDAPERGATLVLAVDALLPQPQPACTTLSLRGPGIADSATVHAAGLDPLWLARRNAWVADFPLGIDLVLCAPQRIVALPRTTHIDLETH